MKNDLFREKSWQGGEDIPLQGIRKCEVICPYCTIKPELCIAAITSSMIDKQYCSGEGYEDCPIFLINKEKKVDACLTSDCGKKEAELPGSQGMRKGTRRKECYDAGRNSQIPSVSQTATCG